jgi:hypothetical protein
MGAAWKIRARLNVTNGNATGDLIANNLFLGWMNGYNQTLINSLIEIQWLTLDDNDGNINNGTPHYPDIDGGFRDQGFPGFTPPTISIINVTDLPDTTDGTGPFAVSATIDALTNPPLTATSLFYRRNGAAFTSVAMTNGGGSLYSASIPGQAAGARVDYYISATDSGGHTVKFPTTAPGQTLAFAIGTLTRTYFDNFETAGDNGWTHAAVGDTSNTEDDWQHGTPAGRSGSSFGQPWSDPGFAASGTKCWANDLGITGSSPLGAYGSFEHNYLHSPFVNLTGKWGTRLRFKRWLSVEESLYDHARILVNGTLVWENQFSGNTVDVGWSTQEVELGAPADNSAAAQIEFQLKSDAGLELGGWAIDDVEILYRVENPEAYCFGDGTGPVACPCNNFGTAGRGCATSQNPAGALLSGSGSTSPDTLVLTSWGELAHSFSIMLEGPNDFASPVTFGDGLRCVGNPFKRLYSVSAVGGVAVFPPSGALSISAQSAAKGDPIAPGSSRNYQVYFRDSNTLFCPAPTGDGFNVGNAVRVYW